MTGAVRIERQGPVATVILERPAVRNAVDPATATRLAEAFLDIDRDETARVAVLWGAGGTFCAGADLGAVAAGWDPSSLRASDGTTGNAHGPMGPTRLARGKPVIAAVSGHAVAGRPRTRPLVRPARDGRRRRTRRVLPAVGGALDRRRHGPLAPPRRRGPRDGTRE